MIARLIFALVLAISSAATAQVQWSRASEIYVNPSDSKRPVVLFVNSYSGAGVRDGAWLTIDLKPFGVSPDAQAAFLAGLLIITHGTTPAICDMTISLRAPGGRLDAGNAIGQVIEPHLTGGQRSTMGTWVPLVDGAFEVQWRRSTQGEWPGHCSYGINLSLQAWTR